MQIKTGRWRSQLVICCLTWLTAGASGMCLRRQRNRSAHYTKKSDFRPEFHNVVNHMLTIDEFEEGWKYLIEKYNLKNHDYMTNLYEIRHKWAKPFFKGVFCAKMISTQRSESANQMLKNYVPPGCPMHMFVRKYMSLIFDRESEENYEEKRTAIVRSIQKLKDILLPLMYRR